MQDHCDRCGEESAGLTTIDEAAYPDYSYVCGDCLEPGDWVVES